MTRRATQHGRGPLWRWATVCMLVSLAPALPGAMRQRFYIPAAPIAEAAAEWSVQSDLNISWNVSDMSEQTTEVSGEFEPLMALAIMLSSTSLQGRQLNERTVSIGLQSRDCPNVPRYYGIASASLPGSLGLMSRIWGGSFLIECSSPVRRIVTHAVSGIYRPPEVVNKLFAGLPVHTSFLGCVLHIEIDPAPTPRAAPQPRRTHVVPAGTDRPTEPVEPNCICGAHIDPQHAEDWSQWCMVDAKPANLRWAPRCERETREQELEVAREAQELKH